MEWIILFVSFLVVFVVLFYKNKQVLRERNITIASKDVEQLVKLRSGKWEKFQPSQLVPFKIQGKTFYLRAGLTFTPYADSSPCTAHCHFCSETLERTSHKNDPTPYDIPKIRDPLDHKAYFEALQNVFEEFRKIPFTLGLSLSGLESTADPNWIISLCELLSLPRYEKIFEEKVLYSNGSGLVEDRIISALRKAGVQSIELSRQHYDEKINQSVMRFSNKASIRKNEIYEQTVKKLTSSNESTCKVKNSCILTKAGISSVSDIENFVLWAKKLGIRLCVFRELCQLESGENGFIQNRTKQWIDENRVPMEDLANQISFPCGENKQWRSKDGWKYLHTTVGYYYYNEHYLFSDVEVILEVSSYNALQNSLDERPDVVDKMVFNSNGNLTSAWDSKDNIIAKFPIASKNCNTHEW